MERFLYKRPEEKNPKINVWCAYPAIESFAMASLGYLSVFKMLDLDSELFLERIYLDSKNTLIKPKDVDVISFSVSFENDIFNIIKILKKYDIPLKSSERKESDPIIFAGGPVLMSNPKPFEEFFDFISIGEKSCLKNAFEVLKKKNEIKRDEILKELSKTSGIYVPKYPQNKVEIIKDDLKEEVVFTPILSDKSFFSDTFIIEISRGCPKMCNFCLASWLNLPYRFYDYEKIIDAIDLGLKYTNKIALLGAYVAGHPKFKEIIKYISKKSEIQNIELSISSLRADLADEELIETLVKCNQKTATIALEASSQRLRDYIDKDLTEEQILKTVETAVKGGLKGLKIYIMIGLPTENDEDIKEFIILSKKMKEIIKKYKKPFELTFSASTFVPKAQTPFEKAKRADEKILKKRIEYLKKEFHKLGISFRAPSVEWDMIQSILSRYDKSLADFLIEVEQENANLGAFKKVWRNYNKKGILPPMNVSAKAPLNNTKTLEWDFIDSNALELKRKRQEHLNLYR